MRTVEGSIEALNNGFHLVFTTVAIVVAISAIEAFVAIKKPNAAGGNEEEEEVEKEKLV